MISLAGVSRVLNKEPLALFFKAYNYYMETIFLLLNHGLWYLTIKLSHESKKMEQYIKHIVCSNCFGKKLWIVFKKEQSNQHFFSNSYHIKDSSRLDEV